MPCSMGTRDDLEKAKEYRRKEQEEEAAYAPFRTPGLVQTKLVRHPRDLDGRTPVHLPIVPRAGLGPFLLGSPRAQVRQAMAAIGLPLEYEKPSLDRTCASSLEFEYDKNGKLWFVGASYDARIHVTYLGQHVFDLEARELFDLINSQESVPLAYNPDDLKFDSQIVTLWEAETQYDALGDESRPVWAQVGLGNQAYADAVLSDG